MLDGKASVAKDKPSINKLCEDGSVEAELAHSQFWTASVMLETLRERCLILRQSYVFPLSLLKSSTVIVTNAHPHPFPIN